MQVIVFPKGQLMPKEKEKLTKHGFLAIEADDPKSVVLLIPTAAPLASADDLFMAAMAGITSETQYNKQAVMANELYRRLKIKEQKS